MLTLGPAMSWVDPAYGHMQGTRLGFNTLPLTQTEIQRSKKIRKRPFSLHLVSFCFRKAKKARGSKTTLRGRSSVLFLFGGVQEAASAVFAVKTAR